MKKQRITAFILAVLLVLGIGSTNAGATSGNETITLAGQIGGIAQAVSIHENFVFAGIGARLFIFELTHEGSLKVIGSTKPLPGVIKDIVVHGKSVLAACGAGGLSIIDINDISEPLISGTLDTPGDAQALDISGDMAVVADGPNGVVLADVSDPAHPVEIGTFKDKYTALDVVLSGDYAYIAAGKDGLITIDVDNPVKPEKAGAYHTQGYTYAVSVNGTAACLADGGNGIRVLDITDPKNPSEQSAYDDAGWAVDAAFSDDTILVTDAFMGLRIFRIADEKLTETGGLGVFGKMAASDGRAIVAEKSQGLLVIDITQAEPVKIGSLSCLEYTRDVESDGKYVYVTTSEGMQIIDVSDINKPMMAGAYVTGGSAEDLRISGEYALIAASSEDGESGLHIVDISNPAAPARAGFYSTDEGEGKDICLELGANGEIAFIGGKDGVHIIKISNTDAPERIAEIPLQAAELEFSNGFLYSVGDTFTITDVSNPREYVILSSTNLPSWFTRSLCVDGNYAFIGVNDRVMMYDTTNPERPVLINEYKLDGICQGLEYANKRLYASCNDKGVTILDVSDIKKPAAAGSFNTAGTAMDIAVWGDYVHVADGNNGLVVLKTDFTKKDDTKPNDGKTGSQPNSKDKNQKIAYITIDDGPSRSVTPMNLDTLKKYGVKATFFVLPRKNVDDIYQRILDEGHVIGNHSYSHDYDYLYSSPENFRTDVLKARTFIYQKLGYTTTLFRFPGGSMAKDKNMIQKRIEILKELGYRYFDWNSSTSDTDKNLHKYGTEEEVANLLANNVLKNTKGRNKLVVLMHDTPDKIYTAKALPIIIEGLQEQGYVFDVLTNY